MNKNIIKLGIIGLGHVADHQLAALKILKDKYFLAAVCDQNAEQFAKTPNVATFTDIERLLEECEIDCLLVSVPNSKHFSVAEIALSQGVSVLVEKPATETVEQFNRLSALAMEHEVLLHTAFHSSFARELLWYLSEKDTGLSDLGQITGIRCGFYDPYIQNGILVSHASSLGGSWIDSGINALSVVAKLAPSFNIESARLTKLPEYDCAQVQGSADFNFEIKNNSYCGQGLIDTNWTLNLNHKSTHLFFAQTGNRICLNHTGQKVELINESGETSTIADFSNELPRMTAHYVGVFNDFYECFQQKLDNRELSLNLLKKLYFAEELQPNIDDYPYDT